LVKDLSYLPKINQANAHTLDICAFGHYARKVGDSNKKLTGCQKRVLRSRCAVVPFIVPTCGVYICTRVVKYRMRSES